MYGDEDRIDGHGGFGKQWKEWFPESTEVPEGFAFVDFPACIKNRIKEARSLTN